MDPYPIAEAVEAKLARIGGFVAVLDERCITMKWNHLFGLIGQEEEGGPYTVKVYTAWRDADEARIERVADIPDRTVELFANFWKRRFPHLDENDAGPACGGS